MLPNIDILSWNEYITCLSQKQTYLRRGPKLIMYENSLADAFFRCEKKKCRHQLHLNVHNQHFRISFLCKIIGYKTIGNVKCKGLDSSTHVEHIEQMWLD